MAGAIKLRFARERAQGRRTIAPAARATSSFPGAFPPARILECRALLETYHDLRRAHTAWVQRIHAVFFHQGAPPLGEGVLRTEQGLAVLRLDRLRSLVNVYPGVDREDEMVAAFDYCLHGKGGAAPSIDTAMHGLVDSAHVDHLHPDSGIALATAVDGEIAGTVGVLGPTRMDYRQALAAVEAISQQLGDVLS